MSEIDEAKKKINEILCKIIQRDERYLFQSSSDGYIRWGLVEKDLCKVVDDIGALTVEAERCEICRGPLPTRCENCLDFIAF